MTPTTRDTRPDPEARVDALAAALRQAGYGVGQPKDLARLLAALSANGWRVEREGLDVERLARAMWEAETNESTIYRDRPFEDISDSAKVERRARAAAIVSEYAALGGPDATD